MNTIKKFLKIVLKIIGIIIGAIVTGFLGIILLSFINEDDSNEGTPQVSIEYQGQLPNTGRKEEDIPDSDYYPTIEEAMEYADIDVEDGEEYQRNIDNIIIKFENDIYLTIYFQSFNGDDEICDTFAKFKKKIFGDETRYTFLMREPIESTKDAWYIGNSLDLLHDQLSLSDASQDDGIDPEHCRFIWGVLQKSKMEEGERIDKLRVEGKKPDDVIEFKKFGKVWYFWYYENLESTKAGSQLEYTLGGEVGNSSTETED